MNEAESKIESSFGARLLFGEYIATKLNKPIDSFKNYSWLKLVELCYVNNISPDPILRYHKILTGKRVRKSK